MAVAPEEYVALHCLGLGGSRLCEPIRNTRILEYIYKAVAKQMGVGESNYQMKQTRQETLYVD